MGVFAPQVLVFFGFEKLVLLGNTGLNVVRPLLLQFGIGEIFGHTTPSVFQNAGLAAQKAVAHAAVGCASAAAAGGSCKAGAMSAGFSSLAGPLLPGGDAKGFHGGNFVGRMIVGAIGSKLGGGKYENGALTAAMGYLFNQLAANAFANKYFKPAWDRITGGSREGASEVQEFRANLIGQAKDGIQVEMNGSATAAFGVGLSTAQSITADVPFSTQKSNVCTVNTTCALFGPIINFGVSSGYQASTGTLTRGESIFTFGAVYSFKAGGGFDGGFSIGSNGAVQAGVSAGPGYGWGGALNICKQSTSNGC